MNIMLNVCKMCNRYRVGVRLGSCKSCAAPVARALTYFLRGARALDATAVPLEALETVANSGLELPLPFCHYGARRKSLGIHATNRACAKNHPPVLDGLMCYFCKKEQKAKARAAKEAARRRVDPATYDLIKYNPEGIISQADAVTYGLKVYRDGSPCKKGHRGYRRVLGGVCVDCMRR